MERNQEAENQARSMVAEARQRAAEAHPELEGLATRGPVATMLLERGFSVERTTWVVRNIAGVPGTPMESYQVVVLTPEDRAAFLVESQRIIAEWSAR